MNVNIDKKIIEKGIQSCDNIIVFLDLAMSLFSKSSQEKEIEENSEKKELIKNLN